MNTNGFVPYTGPISLAVGGAGITPGLCDGNRVPAKLVRCSDVLPDSGSHASARALACRRQLCWRTNSDDFRFRCGSQDLLHDGWLGADALRQQNTTGAITVNSSETISAIAVANGYAVSARAIAQYLIGISRSSFIYTVAGNGSSGYSGRWRPGNHRPTESTQCQRPRRRRQSLLHGFAKQRCSQSRSGHRSDHYRWPALAPTATAATTDRRPARSSVTQPAWQSTTPATSISGTRGTAWCARLRPTGSLPRSPETEQQASSGDGGRPPALKCISRPGLRSTPRVTSILPTTPIAVSARSLQDRRYYHGRRQWTTGIQWRWRSSDRCPAYSPFAVTTDSGGNLYIADTFNNVVRKVNATSGVISTVAGNGHGAGGNGGGGYTGDGGPATSAELNEPFGVAVDSAGNLYIADANNLVIRMVAAASGIISTVAGDGSACTSAGGDGGPATSAGFCYPAGVTVDGAGNLYVADDRTPPNPSGQSVEPPSDGADGCPDLQHSTGYIRRPANRDCYRQHTRRSHLCHVGWIHAHDSRHRIPGTHHVSGGMTVKAIAVAPGYIASAPATASYTISSEPTAVITTVVGDGVSGFSSGGGSPGGAQFGSLAGVAVDHSGNLFFADATNDVVWELTAKTGLLSIVAGLGQPSIGDNSGLGASVQLNGPAGVAVDGMGNLFIADTGNNVVWKVAAGTGLTTVYAGNQSSNLGTDVGDGGPATSARLVEPGGLVVDSAGNLYIADTGDGLVRLVSASTGVITSVAGVGPAVDGSNADGIPATSANVTSPGALALDGNGNLYIATPIYGQVRKVTLSTGLITTVAGNGDSFGSSGDGGPATKAEVYPQGLAVDSAGNLYLSDPAEIRKVSAATGIISNFAGNRYFGYSGDGGSATVAELATPQGIAFDASGNLYIADQANYRVREVFSSAHAFVTPGITVTPSATSITTAQSLTVIVAMNAAAGKSTPTGSITLVSGDYSLQQNLANGTTTFDLAPGSLPVGANTLTATYAPDNASGGTYSVASQTATVTVANPIGAAVATVTLTPSASTITNQQAITVAATVAGGSGQATPTGTVTLASGSYSSQQSLANGGASFSIPAGVLTAATNTLTANYSGDSNYAIASGTTTITVVPLLVTVPAPPAVAPGSAATATATVSAGSTFSGTLNLTCALTASPAGAQSIPTCGLNPASVVVAAGGKATTVVTVNTTAASSGNALNQWGGGGILALALLFVTPSLRRRKTTLLLIACGIAIIGCGGGGNASSTPPPTTPATTPGSYTFLVTATDASNAKVTASANLTVTVE